MTYEEIHDLLITYSPKSWTDHGAYGAVFLTETDKKAAEILLATRKGFQELGPFPFRVPHHTISPMGLAGAVVGAKKPIKGEVDLAHGGILFLEDIIDFKDPALQRLGIRIENESLLVVVIATQSIERALRERRPSVTRKDVEKAVAHQAKLLGLKVIPVNGAPTVDISDALEAINRYRRRIGMRPLDPQAAGWTPDDVVLEAQRISRIANPRRLKRRLLR